MRTTRHFTVLLTVSLMLCSVPARAQDDADKAALKALVTNYLAQESALDAFNATYAAYKFGASLQQETVPSLNQVGAQVAEDLTTAWEELPAIDDITASDILGFTSNRCDGPALGDKLAALNNALGLGFPSDIKTKFDTVRDKVCQVIHVAANIKARYDKYQSIKANGIVLAQRTRWQMKRFAGKFTRHYGGGFTLVWKPDIADTMTTGEKGDSTVEYNSWIKFSDNPVQELNLIQKLLSGQEGGDADCGFEIPVAPPQLMMMVGVTDRTSSSVTIRSCIKIHWSGKIKTTIVMPALEIPAPFGYMAELESMKDGAKQGVADQIVGQISGMFSDDAKGNITKMAELVTTLQSAQ